MFFLSTSLYAGTGVWRVPGLLRRIPFVGKLLDVPSWYYGALIRGAGRLSKDVDMITLAGAGWIHHTRRHEHTIRVTKHKMAVRPATCKRIIEGHSQGGLEATEDMLDDPNKAAVVVLWSAPLKGSWLADVHMPSSGGRGMAPDSRYLGELLERQGQMIQRYQREGRQLPLVVLIAAHHDGLVSCDSAFGLHPDWPADRVVRICLSANPHVHHGENVEVIRVPLWQENHLGMVHSKAAIARVREIIEHELATLRPLSPAA